MLRTKSNQELFDLYKDEPALRLRNQDNLSRYHQVLDNFQEFLSEYPPSAPLVKKFLSKWQGQKPATLSEYVGIIKGPLTWYGEDLDLRVKLADQLPEYIEDNDVKKLLDVIKNYCIFPDSR